MGTASIRSLPEEKLSCKCGYVSISCASVARNRWRRSCVEKSHDLRMLLLMLFRTSRRDVVHPQLQRALAGKSAPKAWATLFRVHHGPSQPRYDLRSTEENNAQEVDRADSSTIRAEEVKGPDIDHDCRTLRPRSQHPATDDAVITMFFTSSRLRHSLLHGRWSVAMRPAREGLRNVTMNVMTDSNLDKRHSDHNRSHDDSVFP